MVLAIHPPPGTASILQVVGRHNLFLKQKQNTTITNHNLTSNNLTFRLVYIKYIPTYVYNSTKGTRSTI